MVGRPHAVIAGLVLLLAVALRLPGLFNPPQDVHHVRQSDTASIARVMARDGVDLLHPRIGWAGPAAGTVDSELPLYNALVSVGFPSEGRVGPWGYAAARCVSLLAWLLGGLALWLWVRRRFSGAPLPYLLLYAYSPLAVVFSRTIQPDALAVCLLLSGLERADAASDRPGRAGLGWALFAGLVVGLAVSVKGTVAFMAPLAPLLLLARAGGPGMRGALSSSALAVLLPLAWYWHANVHLGADGASFGIFGPEAAKWGGPATWFNVMTWRAIAGTAVTHALTPLGVGLAALGLRRVPREAELRPFVVGLLAAGAGVMIATHGFWLHNYYQLVWLPFASVLVGAGLLEAIGLWQGTRGARRALLAGAALLLAVPTLVGSQRFVADGHRVDARIGGTGDAIATLVPEGAGLLIVDPHPQSLLYAADRFGFHRTELTWAELVSLRALGAEYLFLSTAPGAYSPGVDATLSAARREVARSGDWVIFALRGPLEPPE